MMLGEASGLSGLSQYDLATLDGADGCARHKRGRGIAVIPADVLEKSRRSLEVIDIWRFQESRDKQITARGLRRYRCPL
jgi:hypothetical protein